MKTPTDTYTLNCCCSERDGAEVPKLTASSSSDGANGSSSSVEAATDASGRAFFGDVSILVDSGKVVSTSVLRSTGKVHVGG